MTTLSNRWLNAVCLCTGTLCFSLAFAGCTPNGSNSSGGSSAQQPQQPQQQVQTYPDNPGPTQQGMTAPVILNLRGPDPAPTGGTFTLDLEINVNEGIQAPVYLTLQLPQGVQLIAGSPSETLNLPTPGRLIRQYTLSTSSPLTQPIIVQAQAQGPNNAWGFNARRQYPAAIDTLPPHPQSPSVGRPPAFRP